MQKALSILLLTTLTIPAWLVATFFWWQEHRLESDLDDRMVEHHPAELTTLRFLEEEEVLIRWEHEHEFEYQGQMYDIVQSYTKGDTTFYVCWPDHEETQLKKSLLEATLKSDSPSPYDNAKIKLIDFLQTLMTEIPSEGYAVVIPNEFRKKINFLPGFYRLDDKQPPVPPPKIS